MKIFKFIIFSFLSLGVTYIAFLYIVGDRVTYLIPNNYQGPLLIIANQKDGLDINPKNIIYDFSKSNVIRIKDSINDGFSPLGYLNYYFINKNKSRYSIETTDDENGKSNEEKIYVWDNYFEIGGCELQNRKKIYYEALVVANAANLNKVLIERDSLIQLNTCKMYFGK